MAQFDRLTVFNTVIEDGMVPLFYHADMETAQSLVGALADGGSRVLEFTNRGENALEVFRALVKYCAQFYPQMIIGIGSVDDAPTAALFLAYGANFIVGPTFNPEVARLCNRRKVAYMPGCGTLNEIANAEEYGAEIVKLFPGNAAGGADFVKSVLAPRPWSRIMPTGGVTPEEDNLRQWFSAGVTCVGMGSKLVRQDWIAAGNYAAITELTRSTLALIRQLRAE
ncbi:bifunctional 4-hydroxy-2-oxoglutarate aldolase/2-dehydro-3-deoxy-phosphogluconate aldolase [Phototrophicus methaneseepsis]|uniref:Bifunctional 4-hydroxy-2-oxoglutarate aldolase/2-dehydro-3-deoxy-phosphogluconate aldolase n=1 Tax=Phototrophicus methaneseepsis TaxID=2710758 RepID=A0A7S8EDN2_9CHLR|nr:bifunctional 4-hydroxy-2-oxoglutarate aldolase/2-dehydro-3-deoxy-phosphogluconate aldolase [Phototrophicus methaneseepsis]QPC85016.1 bifunctional 4-hydroxy-2-oxoglutarate aldolase/2-dehydro-3-deoxy-phosphogluconate aldolase [Phototrophicus methaneseepsis]